MLWPDSHIKAHLRIKLTFGFFEILSILSAPYGPKNFVLLAFYSNELWMLFDFLTCREKSKNVQSQPDKKDEKNKATMNNSHNVSVTWCFRICSVCIKL